LLEVLAVLAIFAILVAMAAPALNGFIARTKRRAVLDGLRMDVQYARMMAVRQGRPATLAFDEGVTTGCTPPAGYASYSGYRVVLTGAGPERTLKRVDLSADARGVCLQMNNVGTPFTFNSRGMLTPMSQRTVRVESGGRADALTVNLTGRVLPSY
jgi:Tfp pilus assembly protein FimT